MLIQRPGEQFSGLSFCARTSGRSTPATIVAVTYLDIIVVGHPRAQPRPRVMGKRVITDSAASATWKALIVAAIIDSEWSSPAPDTPLELVVELALPTAQRAREGKPAIGRPDLDNLVKAAADALMEPGGKDLQREVARLGPAGRKYRGVIEDDAQVVAIKASKRWSPRPGGAHITLRDVERGD